MASVDRVDFKRGARSKILCAVIRHELDFEFSEDENRRQVLTAFGMTAEVMRELADLHFKYRLVSEVRLGPNYVAFHA